MIPFFTDRFEVQLANFKLDQASRKFLDLRKFYCDTATFGYQPTNIRQCLDFFDAGRVLYGTDTPMDMATPGMFMKTAEESIDHLKLSNKEQAAMYYGNVLRMLGAHGNPVRVLLGLKEIQEIQKVRISETGPVHSGDETLKEALVSFVRMNLSVSLKSRL